jgi:hypothetical protein
MRFTVVQLYVVRSALAQRNAFALNSGPCIGSANDLMDRGLVVCTATDTHDATHCILDRKSDDWGMTTSDVLAGFQLMLSQETFMRARLTRIGPVLQESAMQAVGLVGQY